MGQTPRPRSNVDFDKLRQEVVSRFGKTLAYLAGVKR
jgi:hypothetical protein